MNVLKSDFMKGQPAAAIPAAWLNKVATILNTIEVVDGHVERTESGLGWRIVFDTGPTGYTGPFAASIVGGDELRIGPGTIIAGADSYAWNPDVDGHFAPNTTGSDLTIGFRIDVNPDSGYFTETYGPVVTDDSSQHYDYIFVPICMVDCDGSSFSNLRQLWQGSDILLYVWGNGYTADSATPFDEWWCCSLTIDMLGRLMALSSTLRAWAMDTFEPKA